MSKPTILTIDDDETILAVVEATLERNGFTSITALNGEAGLQIIKTMAIDGVVLDWQMPGMDGTEVLRALKANVKTQNIPIIMLTSKNNIADVSECLLLGANDYVVKPFDPDNFIMRITQMLSEE